MKQTNADYFCLQKLTIERLLQINYSSLVDIRIIKHGTLDTTEEVNSDVIEVPVGNQTPVVSSVVVSAPVQAPIPARGIYCRLFSSRSLVLSCAADSFYVLYICRKWRSKGM